MNTTSGKREKVSSESVMKDIKSILTILDSEIDKRKKTLDKNKGLSTFRSIKKKVERLEKSLPKIMKKTRSNKNIKNNFNKPVLISEELSNFLQVDKNVQLTREDVNCAIFTYINIKPDEKREKILKWKHLNWNTTTNGSDENGGSPQRDLRDQIKKDTIIPDDALSKLLNYEEYKKEIDKFLNKEKSEEIEESKSPYLNKNGSHPKDNKLRFTSVIKLIQPHIVKI
jgi:hypothetical protein